MKIQKICVFCGSKPGANPAYAETANELGSLLAEKNITLLYGGAHVGLMGTVADAALAKGGKVIGVMPNVIAGKEVAHSRVELICVGSMHERKAMMEQLSDAFIALPGGPGTLEEFAEIWTWAHLGLHRKPFGILNTAGYYDHFISFLDKMVDEKFLKPKSRDLVLVEHDPRAMLEKIFRFHPAPEQRIIGPGQT